jgi:hypothetical protein
MSKKRSAFHGREKVAHQLTEKKTNEQKKVVSISERKKLISPSPKSKLPASRSNFSNCARHPKILRTTAIYCHEFKERILICNSLHRISTLAIAVNYN